MKKVIRRLVVSVLMIALFVGALPPLRVRAATPKVLTSEQIANYFRNKSGAQNGCLAFVADGFANLGAERSSKTCAHAYMDMYMQSSDISSMPVGADIFFIWTDSYAQQRKNNPDTKDYVDCGCSGYSHHMDHVGVYIGDGRFVDNGSGGSIYNLSNCYVAGWGIHGNVRLKNQITVTDNTIFTSISHSNITENSAVIKVDFDHAKWIENCGFIIGKKADLSDGTIHYETDKNAIPAGGTSSRTISYNISDWHGDLSQGTKYYYQFFVERGGVTVKSNIKNFTTEGPVSNLKQTIVKIGRDDYYVVKVKLKDTSDTAWVKHRVWTKDDQSDKKTYSEVSERTAKGYYDLQMNYEDFNNSSVYHERIYEHKISTDKNSVLIDLDIIPYKLNSYVLSLDTGKTFTLKLSPSPGVTVTWTSSDESIATVSSSGKITAKGKGKTTVVGIFTINGIQYEATCTVNVRPLESISLSKTSLSLEQGKSSTLTVTYNPSNTTSSKNITWTSSNSNVAKVDGNGKVTAVAPGKATITATSTVNGVPAKTCKVTVTSTMTGISLSKSSLSLEKGKTSTLTVTYNPSNTTSSKTITWKSSNTNVAKVDANGKITAVAPGTATITATPEASGVPAKTCKVTVTSTLTSISLSDTSLELEKGKSVSLTVTYVPADTTSSKAITWTSSDDKIATVDKSGKVTAVSQGTATITATSAVNGVPAAKCYVKVSETPKQKDPKEEEKHQEPVEDPIEDKKTKEDTPVDTTDTKDEGEGVTEPRGEDVTIDTKDSVNDRNVEPEDKKTDSNTEKPQGTTAMYRLYNKNSGEHFYTARVSERNNLVNAGWQYEGTGWIAPSSGGKPVYRLYNPNAGDHHYTMSVSEKNRLVKAGWKDEGIGWYSASEKEGKPLYRLYNPNAVTGSHHYTMSESEKRRLVSSGWRYEGIAWYGM